MSDLSNATLNPAEAVRRLTKVIERLKREPPVIRRLQLLARSPSTTEYERLAIATTILAIRRQSLRKTTS